MMELLSKQLYCLKFCNNCCDLVGILCLSVCHCILCSACEANKLRIMPWQPVKPPTVGLVIVHKHHYYSGAILVTVHWANMHVHICLNGTNKTLYKRKVTRDWRDRLRFVRQTFLHRGISITALCKYSTHLTYLLTYLKKVPQVARLPLALLLVVVFKKHEILQSANITV